MEAFAAAMKERQRWNVYGIRGEKVARAIKNTMEARERAERQGG
jgi:hypothetical protein